MADLIDLPTAAAAPIVNQRQRGSYGRKIVSFNAERVRRRRHLRETQEPPEHRIRDTKELLQNLAGLAELEGGSVIVVYRRPNGDERVALTGIYETDPGKVLRASVRICQMFNSGGGQR